MSLKFTIVIPNFNSGEVIERAIQSLISQNYPDLQLILGAGSFNSGEGFDWPQGDFNGDTRVNNTDLQLILSTGLFGQGTYAASSGAIAAPEPGSLLLLCCGLFGLLLRRRPRQPR